LAGASGFDEFPSRYFITGSRLRGVPQFSQWAASCYTSRLLKLTTSAAGIAFSENCRPCKKSMQNFRMKTASGQRRTAVSPTSKQET
jgi:hypothetical protein